MSNTPTVLGMTCTACGAERKKKSVAYHPTTFLPYCENPFICKSEDHPNTNEKVLERKSIMKLLSYDEAAEHFEAWLQENHGDPEYAEKLRKLIIKPSSVRIGTQANAEYIMGLMSKYEFPSTSEAIRHCIEVAQQYEKAEYVPQPAVSEEHGNEESEPEPEPEKETVPPAETEHERDSEDWAF